MSSPAGVTEGLARFIHDTPREGGIPDAVAGKACKAIVDAFAAVLCGAASEVAPPLFRYLRQSGAQGDAIVLGTNVRTSAEMAALQARMRHPDTALEEVASLHKQILDLQKRLGQV